MLIISMQKSYEPLLGVFVLTLFLSGKDAWRFLYKTVKLMALFSLFITLSYSFMLYIHSQSFWHYFVTVNLRSFDMLFLTLLFGSRVNLYEAFSFSKELTFLLVLSVSKIMSVQRVFGDYKDALRSRTLKKPTRNEVYGYMGSAIGGFLERNIQESKENYEAMRSRGFHV
jgi:cobalt/nickel transport system permease protein